MIIEKHEQWLSSAGYPQERWDIIRDDGLELGQVSQSAKPMPKSLHRCYQGSGTWHALTPDYKSKYFVHKARAIKWLERQRRDVFPVSRLNEMLEACK